MAVTYQSAMEDRNVFESLKEYAKANKVAMPEIVARCVEHVFTSDNAKDLVSDLISDAPRSQRGRAPLDPEVKEAREALRQAARSTDVRALQAAIDLLK